MGCDLRKPPLPDVNPQYSFKQILVSNSISKTIPNFTIMSYNVLAEQFSSHKFFPYCSPNYLLFTYRSNLIMKNIKFLNPDIICLQEIDNYRNFYLPNLKENYELFEEAKISVNGDSIIIGLKKNVFSFISKTVINFRDIVLNDFELNKNDNYARFIKGHICLIIEAIFIKNNQKIIIINTHLYWNPEEEEVKLFQLMQIVKFIEERYNPNDNIIICGDFNAIPNSSTIRFLKNNDNQHELFNDFEKFKNISDLIVKNRKIKLESCYEKYKNEGGYPKYTNFTLKFKDVIDYIFYASKSNLKLSRILKIPKKSMLNKSIALPNDNFPSDHLPLMAEFSFLE